MSKFFKAMFCVTFFSVCTRALGFLLKIYLSRKLGSEMLGSYQVTMSIFAVFLTLVSSGIPVVLSRNVSYFSHNNNKKSTGSVVSSGLILTAAICIVVSLFILCFPNVINAIFSENLSSDMLLLLLPALIFSSVYEVLRGALWGQEQFFAISFTEFLEQIIRIIILVLLFEFGITNLTLINKTAFSLSLACIFSSIIVFIIYIKKGGNFAHPKYEFKNLLKTSTPITAVRTVSSLVAMLISIIIPLRLQTYGLSQSEALSEFGIIMGMTFQLIMIPSTLIGSLAVTMIPSISGESNDIDKNKVKDILPLKNKIMFSLKITIIFSTLLLALFVALGKPICEFLYNNSQAGIYLSYAAIAMLPLGISQITSSILNAIGLEMKALKNYAISSAVLILCIYFLPKVLGTFALIIGYISMSTISSLLNLLMLKKRNLIDFSFLKIIFIMVIISLFSALLGIFIYNLLSKWRIFALFISAAIIMCSTILLIFTFNIANFKIVILNKFSAKKYSQ